MELPDEYELLWLFEQEPELMDPGLPWKYNVLTFSVERDGERMVCMIAPAYGDVQIHLTRGDRSVLDLIFGFVNRLSVRKERGTETLVVDFGIARVSQLRVQTKPHFYISWGTALQGDSE